MLPARFFRANIIMSGLRRLVYALAKAFAKAIYDWPHVLGAKDLPGRNWNFSASTCQMFSLSACDDYKASNSHGKAIETHPKKQASYIYIYIVHCNYVSPKGETSTDLSLNKRDPTRNGWKSSVVGFLQLKLICILLAARMLQLINIKFCHCIFTCQPVNFNWGNMKRKAV